MAGPIVETPFGKVRGITSRMAGRLRDAWIAFARDGKPRQVDLPDWPVYSPDDRATTILDYVCRVVVDPHSRERLAWAPYPNH
jgi:para-nitrobenzyl esterase